MARRKMTAIDIWRSNVEMGMLALEAQSVIAMRLMGMAGAWPVARSENKRMVREKPPEFAKAGAAAAAKAFVGARPDQVLSAALRPLTAKTRANRKRLSRRAGH